MKVIHYLFITLSFLVSMYLHGQIPTSDYTITQRALLIDSLENSLTNSSNYKNAVTTLNLSLLYKQIDLEQSKQYSFKYLNYNDSITSIHDRNIIFGLLAHIYEIQNIPDSSYYYLSLQANFIDASYEEQNEMLKDRYLKNNDDSSNSILGLSKIHILILSGSLLLLIVLIVYYLIKQKQLNKIVTVKNQELEDANTKLKEFNNVVNQKVISNTSEIAIKLEESNKTIVELRKSLKKAEESNYLKNTFLGSMSHQIRTPLSGIMGFSDMLETELAVIGNEELFDYAKNIRESGAKLMGLITNIFDISSIEANILELNLIECDVNLIIIDIEKESLFKAKEKGIIYKTKLGSEIPSIKADVNSLVKVLNIIIDNAIKYTSKGFVTISSTGNTDNTATIRIADKGVGIDKEALNTLLSSFNYKKQGSLLTYQNSGLGLILAHKLLELMNGKLEITSKIGIGTEVSITLPYAAKTNNVEASSIATNQEALSTGNKFEFSKVNIFIVEDDRMNRLVLEKMLKKAGKTITAIDGPDTLKKIEESIKSNNIFDIMLFDINLPQPWDGIKLMHEVKKQFPAYKNIPFIAQTAYAMAYDKDAYLEAGFNDYIAKPINKTELITMIQKQLELFSKK